jgi:dUTP pyrophosphatase|uniref:dUTP diphosphatase n=1 Tax=viral metagenome TaxID=1070528 RepID=A0A6C0I5Y8_9ZZZZ
MNNLCDNFNIHVNILKCHEDALLPKRGSDLAAGSDLYSVMDYVIEPKSRCLISTGWKMQFPHNVYGRIAPRSGLALKNGIDVMAGVIDPDYTGVIMVLLYNTSDIKFEVQKGDRIAQIIFEQFKYPQFKEVDILTETQRSSCGFGSTGLNYIL